MEMVLTFFKYSFLKKVQSLDSLQLNIPTCWLSTLGCLSCWLTSAFRRCTNQPASQSASRLSSQPASSVDKLISDLCCNWRRNRLFQCFGCPLPTPNSWGISYRPCESELVLFIDGVRLQAASTTHQIRLMGDKSVMCSGEKRYRYVFGRGQWLSMCVLKNMQVKCATGYLCVCVSSGQPAGYWNAMDVAGLLFWVLSPGVCVCVCVISTAQEVLLFQGESRFQAFVFVCTFYLRVRWGLRSLSRIKSPLQKIPILTHFILYCKPVSLHMDVSTNIR